MSDEKRTTAYGLWRYAADYLLAAQEVASPRKQDVLFVPAYFLVGHSIELVLKAYLRAVGLSVETLRTSPFGHDLKILAIESRKRKIGRFVKLNDIELANIKLLSVSYKPKELEYIMTGPSRLPNWNELENIASKLTNGLKQYCYKKSFNHRV